MSEHVDRNSPNANPLRLGDPFHRQVFERCARQRNCPSALQHPCAQVFVSGSAASRDAAVGIGRCRHAVNEIARDLEVQCQRRPWSARDRPDEGRAGLRRRGNVNAVQVNQIACDSQRAIVLHESEAGNLRLRACRLHTRYSGNYREQDLEYLRACLHFAPCTVAVNQLMRNPSDNPGRAPTREST
jgi:hypothetical protein